jgi:DNA gyrase/topoisomerase IV subunit A
MDADGKPVMKTKGSRGAKVRDGDSIVQISLTYHSEDDDSLILVYTEKGEYTVVSPSLILEMGKNTQGNLVLPVSENDRCKGFFSIIPPEDRSVVIITSRGLVRKESLKYFEVSKKRRQKYYLAKVDDNDSIVFACTVEDNDREVIQVNLKSGIMDLNVSDIPVIARRAPAAKMIPVANGDKIISCNIKLA